MCSERDTEAGNESRMERLQCDNIKVYFNTFPPSQKEYLTVALQYYSLLSAGKYNIFWIENHFFVFVPS